MADKGKYQAAINLVRLAAPSTEIEPVNPDFPKKQPRSVLLGDAARCYFLMGDKENAKRFFEQAVKTDLDTIKNPDSSVRIKYYLKLKNYDEALRLASVALDHPITDDPADKAYLFARRYEIFKQMGETMRDDLERALRHADVALREHPLSSGLYFSRAEWFMELGDWVRAYWENAKAVALWPRCCLYQLQAAEIYAHYFLSPKEALNKLALADCAWTIGRDSSGVPTRKARVYEALGDFQKAEMCYGAERDVCTRCDNLEDFFTRRKREADKIKLREKQRTQPRFLDRVSERELIALF
jgi:tetratricopeptide (TPR) repeat protein